MNLRGYQKVALLLRCHWKRKICFAKQVNFIADVRFPHSKTLNIWVVLIADMKETNKNE